MNSWTFLTIMVMMSVLTGLALSYDTQENTYRNYVFTKEAGFDEMRESTADSLDSVQHAAGQFEIDETTGDTLQVSNDIWKMMGYAFNPMSFPKATNKYESFIAIVFGWYKTLLWAYAALLIFMVFKNKKND